MKQVEIHTVQEAAKIMPMLSVIRIALLLNQGQMVTVVDEQKDIEYIFKPQNTIGSDTQ